MAIVRSSRSREQISLNTQSRLKAVRVKDIILDINHSLAEEFGEYDAIGTIFYSDLDNNNPNTNPKDDPTAIPLFSHLKYYPLINEIVLILTTHDKNIYDGKQSATYYLPQVNMWGHPHHNALPTVKGLDSEQTANDYQETGAGLVRKVEDGGTDITLGKYFKEQINIKPLLPYEGDMILEGRFGNSIRFGSTNNSQEISNPNAWSDSGNTGDPITIIRNGQSSNLDEKGWLPTTERINEDASSVYLTSNQRIQNFTQASPYMESWNAEYIEPQTIEQALLEPAPLSQQSVDGGTPLPDPALPPTNEDVDTSSPVTQPGVEQQEIDEVVKDPQTTNEAENQTENQIIQLSKIQLAASSSTDEIHDITLPDSFIDPGSGGGSGGGATSEVETTK